jgi:hypothetical protein
VAWSVLVRGLATVLTPDSQRDIGVKVMPDPIVPEPGEMILSIRADVVTGRRFPLH